MSDPSIFTTLSSFLFYSLFWLIGVTLLSAGVLFGFFDIGHLDKHPLIGIILILCGLCFAFLGSFIMLLFG